VLELVGYLCRYSLFEFLQLLGVSGGHDGVVNISGVISVVKLE
jgi:hypothetical protein